MNTEQERADFEAWLYLGQTEYEPDDLNKREIEIARLAFIEGRAALQSQATEAFPCRIVEADFETGTVTLEMHGKYTVSSGQKYLCDAPLQSQDREDAALAETLREAAQIIAAIPPEHAPQNIRWPIVDELEGFALRIDYARRIEGDKSV